MKKTTPSPHIFWLALALGWLFDWFFYGNPLGISLLLFVGLALAVLAAGGGLERVRVAGCNLWLWLPLLFFAGMAFVRANPFLTTMNVLAVLILLSYAAFYFANGRLSTLTLTHAAVLPLRVVGLAAAQAGPVAQASGVTGIWRQKGRRNLAPILRGGLLAFPVIVVFTILLTSADQVFADYVEDFFQLEFLEDVVEWVWRGLLILGVAWLAAGGIALALTRRDEDEGALDRLMAAIPRSLSIGFVETAVILTLVDLLFLAFTAVQFTYLFGGRTAVEEAGYTYSEYARRGFFELVAVAVLSLSLSIFLNWLARRETKRQLGWFNGLVSLLVGLVGVMLASALQRMRLYESAFGYTELRLIVFVFLGWLAVTLVWFLLTLWTRPDRFVIGAMLAAMGFLATMNLINPDALIVGRNLARYRATNDLDVTYLITLSDDAVPGLVRALTLTANDQQQLIRPECNYYYRYDRAGAPEECLGIPSEILSDELNGRFTQMKEDEAWRQWQSFHFSRWRSFALLSRLFRA